MQPSRQIELSVVAPLYNEEGNVKPLVDALTAAVAGVTEHYEIVLVNDGSRDGTWPRIVEISQADAHVKGVCLSRNFGHQNALMAGLAACRGQAVVTMDGDLQHPPEMIPQLFEAWKNGYQIVCTCREDAQVTGFFKRLSSRTFYKIFSVMTNVPMSAGSNEFRLVDRKVVDAMLQFGDVDLFIRGIVNWLGFRNTTISYSAAKRFSGTTKYSLRRLCHFAGGAILSFSTKPLILAIWLGLFTSLLALLEIVYVIVQYFRGQTVPGWASVIAVMAFLFGVLFIILGILGCYLSRIHMALQRRPHFVVSETTNSEQKAEG